MSVSVLSSLSQRNVSAKPFAHLVSDEAMETSLYRALEEAFPPLERFTAGLDGIAGNQAIRIPARDIVGNPEFSPEWREFFAYHTSQNFWADILRVMGESLIATHPHLEKMAGKPLEKWTAARRGTAEKGDVALDALFVINTPVARRGSVRPAHVDSENEIWAGLLYMRANDEDAEGGDLALYSFKGKPAFGGHYAPLSAVNEECRIPYGANRLIGFVNSAKSIHGVTPRAPTRHHRRYVNLVAITPFNVFSLPKMSPWAQFNFWRKRRKTKAAGTMARPARHPMT